MTSGPGRGPTSDGRVRGHRGSGTRHGTGHRRGADRRRARHRPPAPADELRRRAELLFGERAVRHQESGNAPPEPQDPVGAATTTVRGPVPGLSPARPAPAAAPGPTTASRPERSGAAPLSGPPATSSPDWRERAGLALRERMPVWLQTRCGVDRRGAVALAVVLVAAAVLAAQHFWTGRAQSVSAPQVVRTEASRVRQHEDTRGAKGGAAMGASTAPGGDIVVDVSGKVREPGIRRLPAGSRVADALRAAGGVRPGVGTDGLNRARFLVDGEQVVVGTPAGAPAAPGPAGGAAAGPVGAGPTAPVSLNTATVDQLDTLPGVGPVLAQHVIDYRTQHGGFRSVDELREVNGIGDRRFTDLKALVRP
ncbi:DNA-binding protein [Streptomyces lucensis JCM 4490]|uniref:DNA-binding protein n=1 Tax=Streptomyces lucensis JCM 4490 TaxID=1306176 RepID=A0A918MMS5_9ACTN|nr:DNA-binding protein [Streptomyces lucensis JCM 4490]